MWSPVSATRGVSSSHTNTRIVSQMETSLESNPEITERALPVTVSLMSTGDTSELIESVQSIIECCTSDVQTGEWTFPQDSIIQ